MSGEDDEDDDDDDEDDDDEDDDDEDEDEDEEEEDPVEPPQKAVRGIKAAGAPAATPASARKVMQVRGGPTGFPIVKVCTVQGFQIVSGNCF
jgi:hypothetical protein